MNGENFLLQFSPTITTNDRGLKLIDTKSIAAALYFLHYQEKRTVLELADLIDCDKRTVEEIFVSGVMTERTRARFSRVLLKKGELFKPKEKPTFLPENKHPRPWSGHHTKTWEYAWSHWKWLSEHGIAPGISYERLTKLDERKLLATGAILERKAKEHFLATNKVGAIAKLYLLDVYDIWQWEEQFQISKQNYAKKMKGVKNGKSKNIEDASRL